jgi:outer membrane protein TolC
MSYNLSGSYASSGGERNGLNFDSHKAVASISVQQPLLRNLWIDQGRWVIQVKKKNLAITELGVVYLSMDVVNRVQQAYYELLYARAALGIQNDLLRARQQMLAGTRRKIEQGLLTGLDEKLAQAQVAAVESALISASNLVALAENQLRTLMGDPFIENTPERLLPVETLYVLPESLNLAECRLRSLAKRPDLAQLREDIEKSNIDIKYRRNQLFPSLDLVAGYGRKGADSIQVFPPFNAEASASAAFDAIRRGDAPNHMVGVIFSIPFTRAAEKSNYRVSKQIKEQVTLRLKQREELVLREVTDAWGTATSSFERVSAAGRSREFAEAALAAEERKLAGGKSSLFFVLQLQADLAASQELEARAKADYNQALSQLQFAEGSLLDAKRIVVEMRR